MAINSDETILAIKISQVIQDYFDQNKNSGSLKSTEIYEVLYKKGVNNWDRNSGTKFRDFLKKLSTGNALYLIPQCRAELNGKTTTWYFESTPGKTIKARRLVPMTQVHKDALKEKEQVS